MSTADLLADLNDAQREAVLHIDGPLLILAGPGSGKTRVVTHRIAHLLEQGIHASQILALTFTNKAADEMRTRVATLAPGARVWLGTFHRFGVRMLRKYGELVGLAPNFTIYDTSDSKQTIKRVIESQRIETAKFTAERIAAAISAAKNKLITAEAYQPKSGSPLSEVVAKVYPAYQQRLLQSAAVDFDDLLLHVASLLHENPEVRAQLDEQFKYVLVDEYQDTNRAQYVILRALSHDYPNLAATGDPDQSIYGWRGADLNNILEFERDYPQVKVVRLEENYRSTQRILRIADDLIAHNKKRKQKSLWTKNPEGPPVKLITYADQDEEARDIARQIRESIDAGSRRANEYAVFYRMNALSRAVERAMREAQVPYQMVRGQEFYQRKEIKDVLSYCQLLNNPLDDIACERAINTPSRGIGERTLERLGAHAYEYRVALLDAAREALQIEGLAKRTATKVAGFVATIDAIAKYQAESVEEVIGAVLSESGYRDVLAASDDEEDQNRLANIEELLTDARQFDERYEGHAPLEDYLERTWLVNDIDGWETDSDKVTLMTLHAAKGLEFPVVFLVALEDGILPHERSAQSPDELEEERRLAFVGITRAKQELQLSLTQRRDFRGQRRISIPSSFLMELPRHEMDQVRVTSDELTFDPMEFDGGADDDISFDFGDEPAKPQAAPIKEVAVAVTTAAALAEKTTGYMGPAISPDEFTLHMTVVHAELGPGKIVALSGSGKNRRATIQFPVAGQKRYVLAHAPLRPANR